MTALKQLFEQQQAGFTVYSPDCTQSRLWGNLDQAIHTATGFSPVYRHWINHDINSVMRFYVAPGQEMPPEQDPVEGAKKYDNIPAETLRYGHLMAKLLLSGPSLLTIWQGDQAVETLLALKGVTHPAEAAPDSIRGRFWCDNAICNLLHVSDDYAEAKRELQAIRLTPVLEETRTPLPLLDPIPNPTHYAAHCGISVVCDVVNRMILPLPDVLPLDVQLPPGGDAKETDKSLTALLRHKAEDLHGSALATFIEAFLAGDVISVTHGLAQMPVTPWEHFIIQCSAMTRDKWNSEPGQPNIS